MLEIGIALDQSMLVQLEAEARWVIDSGLSDQQQVPDFLLLIHADSLKSLRPDKVTLIN